MDIILPWRSDAVFLFIWVKWLVSYYDDEGHIYGRTTDAQKTIEILNLDCSTIVHRRKAAFEAYSSLDSASDIEWASEIARLKGRNKDNQYEEYCVAVIYFIEHYLAI